MVSSGIAAPSLGDSLIKFKVVCGPKGISYYAHLVRYCYIYILPPPLQISSFVFTNIFPEERRRWHHLLGDRRPQTGNPLFIHTLCSQNCKNKLEPVAQFIVQESGSQSFQMRLSAEDSGDYTYRCFLPGYEGFGETTLSVGKNCGFFYIKTCLHITSAYSALN